MPILRLFLTGLVLILIKPQVVCAESKHGLKVASTIPHFEVKDIHGKDFSTQASLKKGPLVLVFYRGGWCPYCNTELRKLQNDLLPTMKSVQATLAAISVDRLDESMKTFKEQELDFTIISDPDANLVKKYKLAFEVPQELREKYKTYGIDLEKASGKTHHIIAIPSTIVVNQEAKVVYSYVNEDYKTRAPHQEVKDALLKLKKEPKGS